MFLAIDRVSKFTYGEFHGQAGKRMNRTLKDAIAKVFHHQDTENLKGHVLAFVTTCNFARRLKALRWRTLFQAVSDAWTKDPAIFKTNPHHLIAGPHT